MTPAELLNMLLWEFVDKSGDCWLWTANKTPAGYGSLQFLAHRVSWMLSRGVIPDGLHLDHTCRVRACINPDHLEPVTPKENIRRGVSPSALNALKSICKRGHPLEGENVRITAGKGRSCKACERHHGIQWRRDHPDEKKKCTPNTTVPCSICGVIDTHGRKKPAMCQKHYKRFRKYGNPLLKRAHRTRGPLVLEDEMFLSALREGENLGAK